VVEGQRQASVPGIADDRAAGVVGAPGNARSSRQEDRRDGVKAGVSGRIGVRAELTEKLDVERGLLAGLPDRGRLERFAIVDESARQRPAGRRILALDEDDAAAPPAVRDLDDDVDGRERIAVVGASHGLIGLPRPL